MGLVHHEEQRCATLRIRLWKLNGLILCSRKLVRLYLREDLLCTCGRHFFTHEQLLQLFLVRVLFLRVLSAGLRQRKVYFVLLNVLQPLRVIVFDQLIEWLQLRLLRTVHRRIRIKVWLVKIIVGHL